MSFLDEEHQFLCVDTAVMRWNTEQKHPGVPLSVGTRREIN